MLKKNFLLVKISFIQFWDNEKAKKMQNNNEGLILKKCFIGTAINTKKIKITA